MLNIIKHIFIYVCCIYICHAIQNTVYSKKAKKTLLIIVPIVLAILTHILKILYPDLQIHFHSSSYGVLMKKTCIIPNYLSQQLY